MWSKLIAAVEKGDMESFSLLLKQKPELLTLKGGSGESLLHMAVRAGREEMVKALLGAGLKATLKDDFSWTPMHEAASLENSAILRFLLGAKGSADLISQKSELPLHVACRKGIKANVELLIKAGSSVIWPAQDDMTPLHEAAMAGDAEIVELLLKEGAKVNAPNKRQETALHLAAQKGRIKVARLLLDRGADRDRLDERGKRFLDAAADWSQNKFITAFTDPKALVDDDPKTVADKESSQVGSLGAISERVGNRLIEIFFPYIMYGTAACFLLYFLNVSLNAFADKFLFSGGAAGPGTRIQFAFMFYKGKGILGTDIPMTWWFFNGAIVLGYLSRYAGNPQEKKAIYYMVVLMLIFHATTPAPSPLVELHRDLRAAATEPKFMENVRNLFRPGDLFGGLKPPSADQIQNAQQSVRDIQKNLDGANEQIKKTSGS